MNRTQEASAIRDNLFNQLLVSGSTNKENVEAPARLSPSVIPQDCSNAPSSSSVFVPVASGSGSSSSSETGQRSFEIPDGPVSPQQPSVVNQALSLDITNQQHPMFHMPQTDCQGMMSDPMNAQMVQNPSHTMPVFAVPWQPSNQRKARSNKTAS